MTENEFREALKKSVGHAGLSSDRQLKVLARMKGGEAKVRSSNSKMKFVFVLAVVVMMTMGAAVATEIVKYINWEGEPVDYTPPDYGEGYEREADSLRDPILKELIAGKKVEEILIVRYVGKPVQGEIGTDTSMTADTLEEVIQLAGADTVLPMPVSIPGGFEMRLNYCFFATKPGTEYRLVAQESYDHGVKVDRYACEREQLFMSSYLMFFENEQGDTLNMSVRIIRNPEDVLQANAVTVTPIQLEGMDRAIYCETEKYNQLYAYQKLQEPIAYQLISIAPWGIEVLEAMREGAYLDIQMNSNVLTLDEMLGVFSFTAQ